MKPGLSGRGCILACMRIERSSARSSSARSSPLIALANGTSNTVLAPRGGRPDEGPYTCAVCTRADARRGAGSYKPTGELPDGPGSADSGEDADSHRDARLMAFIRSAPSRRGRQPSRCDCRAIAGARMALLTRRVWCLNPPRHAGGASSARGRSS